MTRGARASAVPRRVLPALLATALAAVVAPATVRAQQEPPLQISADHMSGAHGPEGDVVLLRGHVHIRRGKTVITSESGTYERASGMLFLEGGVRIVDSTTTITCDRASYSEQEDVVQLSGHVKALDKETVLEAPAATYDRKSGRADLYGGVTGHYKKQRMTSERAAYFRDSLVVQARGNVRGVDDENRLTLTAREVDFDRGSNEAVARGEPALEAVGDDGRTTRITSRLLRLNTETRAAEAIDSVKVRRDTLQARGDHGVFDDQAGRGWLLGSPRAWDDETNVTGDTLEFQTHGRALQQVVVRGNASLDYRGNRPRTKGEKSLLTGDRVDVFFTGDDIDSLVALGRAKNEYRAIPPKGKTAESNQAEGDTIRIYLKDGKIDEARVQGHARGEYHPAVAESDTASEDLEEVAYDALAIHYVLPKNQIELDGAAHLTYGDLDLKATRVRFDSEKQTLVAEGSPELVDRGEKVVGHLMTYDLETRVGNIYRAETEYEKGLYHGDRIRKVSDDQLDVLGGQYSTCALAEPHYHVWARWMKVYLKDKVVAKPVVLYVGHVPLLPLPFWIFPIKPGRHSGFLFPQFELGFNNAAGRFVRNVGYYWAPNDYFDLTTSGDYYQFEPSWVVRAEGYYKLMYALEGNFRTSFARNERVNSEDWDLDAVHSQDLTPRTRFSARASYVSSRNYNSSNLFGRSIAQRLNRFLTSNLAFTHVADWATYNVVLDRRQDLDADEAIADPDGEGPEQGPPPGTPAPLANLTQNLPALAIGFPTRSIGSLPGLRGGPFARWLETLYLSLSTRFQSFREQRAVVDSYRYFDVDGVPDSTTMLAQRVTERWGAELTSALSDTRKLFGWINLQPSVAAEAALFDHDQLGHRTVPTGTWALALTSNATLYGTFQPKLGPLTGIRHIVTPRASFVYSPEFPHLFYVDELGRKQPRFQSFGSIGVSGAKRERLDFGLDQRLQLRLGSGEKARKLDNLAALTISGSYDFLYREQKREHGLAPFAASLLIQPPGLINAAGNAIVDVYEGRPLRSLAYNLGMTLVSLGKRRPAAPDLPIDEGSPVYAAPDEEEEEVHTLADAWNVGFAYSYAGAYSGPDWESSQTANIVLRMRVTPTWNLTYANSYDVTNHQFGVQQYSLSKDLHCWVGTFSRTFAPGGEAEYYFRLSVKERREIYIDRGTRGGSLGGID